jgi:hypothetical protein
LEFLRDRLGDEPLVEEVHSRLGEYLAVSDLQSRPDLSHEVLIDIASQSDAITERDAEELVEQHRYKGMKTIYLHRYRFEDRERIDQFLSQQDIDSLLTEELASARRDQLPCSLQNTMTFKFSTLSIW